MRAIEATCTKRRHDRSSPAPSAQAIAALIGDTWLTTTTSRVADLVEQLLAGRRGPGRRAQPATRRRAGRTCGSARHARHRSGRDVARSAGRRTPRSRARSTARRARPGGRTPPRSGCARSSGLATTRASAGMIAASAAACSRPCSDNGGSTWPWSIPARSRRCDRGGRGGAPGDVTVGRRRGRRPLRRRGSYRAPVLRRLVFLAAVVALVGVGRIAGGRGAPEARGGATRPGAARARVPGVEQRVAHARGVAARAGLPRLRDRRHRLRRRRVERRRRPQIGVAADGLRARTGAAHIDVISHSMGAISSRYWVERLGGASHVDAWVSLAGVNEGTVWAYGCYVLAPCREMVPTSSVLDRLNDHFTSSGSTRYGRVVVTVRRRHRPAHQRRAAGRAQRGDRVPRPQRDADRPAGPGPGRPVPAPGARFLTHRPDAPPVAVPPARVNTTRGQVSRASNGPEALVESPRHANALHVARLFG